MDHTDQNPAQNVIAIVPARFAATRLPGKMLLPIAGKPLILHTLEQAKQAKNVSRVIVATDDERILRVVEAGGGEAILTEAHHQSGSDRLAEVAAKLARNSIIVNVQGDEPLISPRTIEKVVDAVRQNPSADVATTYERIENLADVLNPNAVKVVVDANNFALYFSRSPVPFPREAANRCGGLENALRAEPDLLANFRKHAGLYVYRREFLLKYAESPPTPLEKLESLEQLRILENGGKIKVVEAAAPSIGVDTAEDFERVAEILRKRGKL